MTNAHYARPERAWENMPTIPATTDEELVELESEPEIALPKLSPYLMSKQIAPHPQAPELMAALFTKCAAQYGISVDELRGRSNKRAVVRARWLAMMALSRAGNSLPEIARAIGAGKHHTTIMYGLEAAEIALQQDPTFARAWENVAGITVPLPETRPLWQELLAKNHHGVRSIIHNQTVLAAKLDEILRRLPAHKVNKPIPLAK